MPATGAIRPAGRAWLQPPRHPPAACACSRHRGGACVPICPPIPPSHNPQTLQLLFYFFKCCAEGRPRCAAASMRAWRRARGVVRTDALWSRAPVCAVDASSTFLHAASTCLSCRKNMRPRWLPAGSELLAYHCYKLACVDTCADKSPCRRLATMPGLLLPNLQAVDPRRAPRCCGGVQGGAAWLAICN